MSKGKRTTAKSKPASTKTTGGKSARYIVSALVVLVAVVGVWYLTREKTPDATVDRTNTQSAIPSLPLRMEFLKEGMLSFYNSSGEYMTTIDIELAENNDERQLGLMFREQMADNQGMFFIFPYDMMQSFWMKNTILPLDMIFINSKQEIVTILRNTTPYAETNYASTAPAQYVLEVNAGFTERLGIQEGYKIGWLRTN